ncbi:hypothetical protein GCM10020255_100580 [Rhodococcus baikonurensis]
MRRLGVVGAVIVASNSTNTHWDHDELTRIESMAELGSVAIEFDEKQKAQRLLSVLADRDRIARDLHDNVIQRLFASGMSLQSTLPDETLPESARAIVKRSLEQLDKTVREIRTTIFDLQTPTAAGTSSLRRRLLDVIGDATAQSSVTPSVQFSGAIDTLVNPGIHQHAEAVLREGLSNVLRHAHAHHITIAVTADVEFAITIEDDGVGLPPTSTRVDFTISSAVPNTAAVRARSSTTIRAVHVCSGEYRSAAPTRIDRSPVGKPIDCRCGFRWPAPQPEYDAAYPASRADASRSS